MTLTLGTSAFPGATQVEVFVGVGGELADVSGDDNQAAGSFRDDTVSLSNAIGFHASLDSLQMATLKSTNNTPPQLTM